MSSETKSTAIILMPAAAPKYPLVFSIVAAIVTLALKTAAYRATGSVGLLSDAVESLVNLAAAVIALISLWYASRPVDDSHTYGHEKIEYFSSGLEGMLILAAAFGIAWYAVLRILAPNPLEQIGLGAFLEFVATLVNLAAAVLLVRVGKSSESIVLLADGKHLFADVWTSTGVLAGLGLVWLFPNMQWLDPIVALTVAVFIGWTGLDLISRSFDGLMDHSLPKAEQAKLRTAIAEQLVPGTTFHALRTRQSGAHRFADFHLLVPGHITVQEGHDLTEKIEAALRAIFPAIEVTVHIEPIEEKAAWQDSPLLPIEQARQKE